MIKLFLKDKEYEFPGEWDELTESEYLSLILRLDQYRRGEISVSGVRSLWFCDISGIDPAKYTKKQQEQLFENLYVASRQFKFMFSIKYPGGSLDHITDKTCKLLFKTPPEDLTESAEIKYARRIEHYEYVVDAVFAKNLIPIVHIKEKTYHGWQVNTANGSLTTSLKALQFIEANQVLNCINDGDVDKLPLLAAIIYYPGQYSSSGASRLAAEFSLLDAQLLNAIVFNWQALVIFLFSKTPFKLLWERKSDKKEEISISMSESLYNLASSGYGNYSDVENMNLITFLSIMRKDAIEGVKSLAALGKEVPEIAEKTGFSIELINKML